MCFYTKTESRKRKESRIEGYTHKEVLHSRPGERKWKFQRKMRKINSERLGGKGERNVQQAKGGYRCRKEKVVSHTPVRSGKVRTENAIESWQLATSSRWVWAEGEWAKPGDWKKVRKQGRWSWIILLRRVKMDADVRRDYILYKFNWKDKIA